MLDSTEVRSIVNLYAQSVKDNIKPDSVYLFGSYNNGKPTEDSDIDVAVIINNFTGNKLELSALLWKLTVNISDKIEPVVLDPLKDQSGFTQEILRTGKRIL